MLATHRPEAQSEFRPDGYKELTMPAGSGGSFLLENHCLHIWPRKSFMLIALPNLDGSFTCTLFLALHGSVPSFESLRTREDVEQFFVREFKDAHQLMPDLTHDFFANPTGQLGTVKCFPWHYKDKVLLIGDAAHAIVPFYGQGMNCAFESCREFIELFENTTDIGAALAQFSAMRKGNTDAIAEMALENFIEMRDKVGDPHFLLKKEIARQLSKEFPDDFVDQYALVTFNQTPYSFAQHVGKKQTELLDTLSKNIHDIAEVDWERARRLVKDYSSSLASTSK
jgi:kynurenine 3-monooxygenase